MDACEDLVEFGIWAADLLICIDTHFDGRNKHMDEENDNEGR